MAVEMIDSFFGGVVKVLQPKVYEDSRGFFLESFRQDQYEALGIDQQFIQDNHSCSVKNVVRGLHFQWDKPLCKLMRVTVGRAFLMTVDIRKGSPTLGEWVGVEASAEDFKQVWAPAGFARGFCALSDSVEIQYKCSAIYNPAAESGILWSDPEIGIDWPVEAPLLSEKDEQAQTLAQWLARPESDNFTY